MSVLSDKDINEYLDGNGGNWPWLKELVIDPLDRTQIQPASIDLKLAGEFRRYEDSRQEAYRRFREDSGSLIQASQRFDEFLRDEKVIDLNDRKASTILVEEDSYELKPGEFILGSTVERVEIPDNLCARVEGKSSLGRLGLLVHATAGYIDPGFRGKITLEIMNLNNRPIILRAGKPICQLSLIELTSPAKRPYGHAELNSKYQDQRGVQESLYEG
jgi:dCTP deaminase